MTSSSTLTAPSSSSLDMSQDQTSSSMESGSQYLESSLHDLDLSDYILDNFPPGDTLFSVLYTYVYYACLQN